MTDVWDEIDGNKMERNDDWGLLDQEKRERADKKQLSPRKAEHKQPEFIELTIHKFKSNIAYYMRECEEGRIKGIILKRYNRRVGFYCKFETS